MLRRTILIGLGANLPNDAGRTPLESCVWAVNQVVARSGLELVACSPWYRSAPVPPSGQPDYVNGALRLRGAADPHALLSLLHAIEAEAGRRRSVANAARPLDLDLLAVDSLVLEGGLVLPHPRLQDRAFVLFPLRDVAPDWVHPVFGSVASMAARADPAGIAPIA